jgi:hypothetical protein
VIISILAIVLSPLHSHAQFGSKQFWSEPLQQNKLSSAECGLCGCMQLNEIIAGTAVKQCCPSSTSSQGCHIENPTNHTFEGTVVIITTGDQCTCDKNKRCICNKFDPLGAETHASFANQFCEDCPGNQVCGIGSDGFPLVAIQLVTQIQTLVKVPEVAGVCAQDLSTCSTDTPCEIIEQHKALFDYRKNCNSITDLHCPVGTYSSVDTFICDDRTNTACICTYTGQAGPPLCP